MRWLLVALLLSATTANAATVADWRSDIDEIVAKLVAVHPNAFTKTGKLTFLRAAEQLKRELPSLSEEQRVAHAMRLVAMIGDGHTQLEPANEAFAWWYPIRIYEFRDGYFVVSAHKSAADLAGAQILEAGGRPIHDVVEAARDLFAADNALSRKEGLYIFHNAPLMHGLDVAKADRSLTIKARSRDGRVVERNLAASKSDTSSFEWRFRAELAGLPFGTFDEWITAYNGLPFSAFRTPDPSRPPHFIERRGSTARAYPDRNTYYFQMNQTSAAASPQRVMADIDAQKPANVIIDIRYNFGGDGSTVPAMMHEFIRRSATPPWKNLFVITGRKTFSAGVMTLDAFLDHTNATIIGEPAGAPLNHYGDATTVDLKRTGMRLQVSTQWHQLSTSADMGDTTRVDIPAGFSFPEYASGKDPAVDPILAGAEMRSLAAIAIADGGAAARRIYDDRKKRFSAYSWWTPAREIDLRNACQTLVDASRFADAVETCRLNTDINPYIWNTWYNLGRAQRAAGQFDEGLESYKRVLEIDPANWNRPSIERLIKESRTFTQPAVIRWNATVAEIESALAGACRAMRTRRIDPPFLGRVKDKQLQIDCEGFSFLGRPRKAEFVFRDDALVMVWILTTRAEEERILTMMKAALGEPTHQPADYIAFAEHGTALRRDKPEVLFFGPSEAAGWRAEFQKK